MKNFINLHSHIVRSIFDYARLDASHKIDITGHTSRIILIHCIRIDYYG